MSRSETNLSLIETQKKEDTQVGKVQKPTQLNAKFQSEEWLGMQLDVECKLGPQKYLNVQPEQLEDLIQIEEPGIMMINEFSQLQEEDDRDSMVEYEYRYSINESNEEIDLFEAHLKSNLEPRKPPKAPQKQKSGFSFFYRDPLEEPQKYIFGKLLWFVPNKKNGKNIMFNSRTLTCEPVFRCQGCLQRFKNAAALGGHWSSCKKKKQLQKANAISQKTKSKEIKKLGKKGANQKRLSVIKQSENVFQQKDEQQLQIPMNPEQMNDCNYQLINQNPQVDRQREQKSYLKMCSKDQEENNMMESSEDLQATHRDLKRKTFKTEAKIKKIKKKESKKQ